MRIVLSITRILTACVSFTVLQAQQYVISTYAGGALVSPSLAISMATDAAGNVYFADGGAYGDVFARSNSVFKIDPNGSITRIAGNSRTGFSGDGGPAISASLSSPLGLAVDRTGNLFIVDAGNQRVRKVTPDGIITTVVGGGSAVLGDGGPATSGQLNYPTSVAIDAAGNLFIGEYGRVRKVSSDGIITTVAGGGLNDPAGGGPATAAQLHNTFGIAVDNAGNLFINDYVSVFPYDCSPPPVHNLLEVSPDGTIAALSLLAVPPPEGEPIAVDGAGNLFVVAGIQIWKISPDGAQMAVAGRNSFDYSGVSGDGGPALQAQLTNPIAVALDSAGELFIADRAGGSIRKVSTDGVIRTLANIAPSTPPPAGDGAPAINVQLELAVPGITSQSGLATDNTGSLYIAETGAHRVRKVSPDGIITTVAGVGGPEYPGAPDDSLPLGDGGPATSAVLFYPTSVAVDAGGDLFIADVGHRLVRKVTPDGTITTVAGNGNAPTDQAKRGVGDGGLATDAPLIPASVAIDGAGNLFILEDALGDVREVLPDGTITTAIATAISSSTTDLFWVGFITAVAADRDGNLFVAANLCDSSSSCHFTIRKVSPAGVVSAIAGATNAGAGDGGLAVNAQLGFTNSLALDTAGNLFLTDTFRKSIRKIDTNGIITTIAGNGMDGYSGDGGPATNASLSFPFGLATDGSGSVYVSDFNQVVRVLRPSSH